MTNPEIGGFNTAPEISQDSDVSSFDFASMPRAEQIKYAERTIADNPGTVTPLDDLMKRGEQ